jgi:hypothetical protein
MASEPGTWYHPEPDLTSIHQGDVIEGLPVIFAPPAPNGPWVLLRPWAKVTLQQALAGMLPSSFRPYAEPDCPAPTWLENEELVVAKAVRRPTLVLTQTCDIGHRNHFQVACVYSEGLLGAAKRESLSGGRVGYLFQLPPVASGEEALFADLTQITSVHKSYLKFATVKRRLSPFASALLQNKLALFHGRPFGFDITDKVPQSAQYRCARCFYESGVISERDLDADGLFPSCARCGDRALWVKALHSPPHS